MKYTRDRNGIAILADTEQIRHFMDKKQDRETVDRLIQEINTLKQEVQELKAAICTQPKSE